jgi:hypothetical protein
VFLNDDLVKLSKVTSEISCTVENNLGTGLSQSPELSGYSLPTPVIFSLASDKQVLGRAAQGAELKRVLKLPQCSSVSDGSMIN